MTDSKKLSQKFSKARKFIFEINTNKHGSSQPRLVNIPHSDGKQTRSLKILKFAILISCSHIVIQQAVIGCAESLVAIAWDWPGWCWKKVL